MKTTIIAGLIAVVLSAEEKQTAPLASHPDNKKTGAIDQIEDLKTQIAERDKKIAWLEKFAAAASTQREACRAELKATGELKIGRAHV